MALIWIIGCALAVTVAGVGGAGLILVTSEGARQRLMRVLVGYAAGALLAAALLGLIPEAIEHAPARSVFLDSVPLGLTTTLAIVAHEVPQEVGDFAVLLDAGQPPRRALLLNLLSGLTAVAGALAGYVWLARVHGAVPYVLGISAATFLHIALVDPLADFHHRVGAALAVQRFAALAAGIATIGYLVSP